MSLIHREARTLKRADPDFRDDRIFLVACVDTCVSERYFSLFQNPRLKFCAVPAPPGKSASPQHVLESMLKYREIESFDERWLMLDTGSITEEVQLAAFSATLEQAKQQGIQIALSKPCFNLWLLLHHVDEGEVEGLLNVTDVDRHLQAALGECGQTKFQGLRYSTASMIAAYDRAERLDGHSSESPMLTTNSTRVYKLVRSIFDKTPVVQVPAEFVGLQQRIKRS